MRSTFAALAALLVAGCVAEQAPASTPRLACDAPCALTLATSADYVWEPHVAAHRADPQHLVAAVALLRGGPSPETFANGLLVAVTRDGGASWVSSEIPHGPAAGPGHPLASARALADPNVAFLPDGTVLVSGLAYNFAGTPVGGFGQGFRAFVARSDDGGASFPDVVVVAEDRGVASITPLGHRAVGLSAPDAPTMAVAPDGVVHLTWRVMMQPTPAQPERSVMVATRSADGARTWSEPAAIDTGGVNAVASQLVALRDGTLLAAVGGWGEGGVTEATSGHQMVARSADGGGVWSVAALGQEFAGGVAWWPTLGASDAGVHAAFPVPDDGGREAVVMRTSRDGGATFGPAEVVARAVAAGHAMPTLGGDGDVAYLTFFQPQEDGGARNRLLAVGLRGGQVTAPIVLDDTLTQDATALGEYFGVAVAGGRGFAVWTHNGDGGELRGAWLSFEPG